MAFFDIQQYMTLTDCPYCHDSVNFTEMATNPRTVRCNICGLFRLYPRMNRDGQIAMLKKLNDEDTDIANLNSPLDNINPSSWEMEKIEEIFPAIFPDGRVLDVGCAEGSFVAELEIAGTNSTGIEPMEKLVKHGKEHGLDLLAGRFEAGGMPSGLEEHSLALICFRESIYYMPDLRETFDLIKTYLRDDGGLYIKCHTPHSLYYSRNKDYSSRYGCSVNGMPTKKALTYMLNHEGYRIHEIGYYPESVFRTLHWTSLEGRIIAKITNRFLSPFVHAVGRGDRVVVYASKT